MEDPDVGLSHEASALSGGEGQGILLVQGNLWLEGGARLTGLVVVRGALVMRGAGGRIAGSVLAGSADVGIAPGQGESLITLSTCAVRRSLEAVAPVRPLRERAWAELYPGAP